MHPHFAFRRVPPGVKWLLIFNGIIFLIQKFLPLLLEPVLGLVPSLVLGKLCIWQLVSYIFLHGSFFHLFFNMFALWMFGMELEYAWGTKEFLKFYFFCGIGAAIVNTILEPFSTIPIIGASGAIYGILVAYAIVFPTSIIYLYGIFPVQTRHFVIAIGALEFLASFHGTPSMVARFAHLGGMLAGYIYMKSYEFRSLLNRLLSTITDFFFGKRPKTVRPEMYTREELSKEVDRILEKVLIYGAESLTEKEREIMRRYSSMKK